ncbi:MAG: rhomboid family intramembrane serine protease [Candidatus Nanosalina sp.]
MAECAECGKHTMSFTCHYCGKKFCSEHRLPENHDCQGLESGKEEEYMAGSTSDGEKREEDSSSQVSSRTVSGSNQKWFKEKNLKGETGKTSRGRRNSIISDFKYTLKNNLTLSIILITSVLYFTGEIFAPVKYGTMLFPNITSSALAQTELTRTAAQVLGYQPTLLTQPWGILTVMLAHGSMLHLFANMVTFYFFGSALEKSIGSRKLLKFYVGTGLIASIGYILFSNILYHAYGVNMSPAVGASGAVVAAVGAVAMLYPDAEVLLYFVFPMKIQTAVKIFGVIETVNLVAKLGGVYLPVIGGFASSAHLTGLAAGIIIGKKLRDRHGGRARINLFQ